MIVHVMRENIFKFLGPFPIRIDTADDKKRSTYSFAIQVITIQYLKENQFFD